MNEECSPVLPSPSASTRGAPAPTRDLEGKVCLVVGGGGMRESSCWNIGMAIAIAYGLAGARVMVTDVREEAAREAAKLIRQSGGQSAFCRMDVAEEESVRGAVAATLDAFGTVDVLHNNVGIGKAGASSQTSAEDWRRIADTNLLGLHLTTQAVLPVMTKKRSGVVLTTSTIGSLRYVGFPHLAYGVTKAAANQFSRLIAVEYAPFGIRANTLIVGLVDTPRIRTTVSSAYGGTEEEMISKRNAQVPLGFMGDAWDVANAAVFLACDKARYISGSELVIDGALTATVRSV